MKGSGAPTDWREIDRDDDGVGWMAYPDEPMQRASHALATDGGVWVVDPLDVPDLDDLLAAYGGVAGVAMLLDRHKRDAAAIAERHGVPVSIPAWFDGVADEVDAPVERFEGTVPDTDFEVLTVVNNRFWQEAALFDGDQLVVPEAVGTAPYFAVGDRRLGVHPALRARPPRGTLGGLDPDRLRVGHGAGIDTDAGAALADALAVARRTMPRLYAQTLVNLLRR